MKKKVEAKIKDRVAVECTAIILVKLVTLCQYRWNIHKEAEQLQDDENEVATIPLASILEKKQGNKRIPAFWFSEEENWNSTRERWVSET